MEEKEQKINQKEKFMKSSWWQAVKFTLFSISAGVIQMGVFLLLNELVGWSFWPSHLISVSLSVVWNFTFNRKFTFKASNNVPIAMLLTFAFYVAFVPASVFGGNALEIQAKWDAILVEALMMVINFVLEFIWQKFVVFNNKIVPDRKAKVKGE